jgi:hypothetical protein
MMVFFYAMRHSCNIAPCRRRRGHHVLSGYALAAASITSLEIGLRFGGMVDEAPRPGTKGSDTPPNSVADIIMTLASN